MSKFVHLHTHSHYSLLNALPKIPDLVKKAKLLDMSALALTDNSNLYGAIEFYKQCEKNDIKPILGIDAYVAIRTRFDKEARIDNIRTRLVLLAKNEVGYKNLIQLVTLSFLEGFYYKPRIDRELIEKYKEGLVCIAPSFSNEILNALKSQDKNKAKETIEWYKKIFGEDFYIEITHHPEIEGHEEKMKALLKLAKETNTQIVAAHDVYYLEPEDKKARDTLISIQTNSDFSDRSGFSNDKEDFSFIDQEKAEKYFSHIPEAIENTSKIADKCNLKLKLGNWVFPNYIVESGLSYDEELRRIVFLGIEKRGLKKTPELLERIEYELGIIFKKGYSPYFLVVADLLGFARENKIFSTTRGSVAGSLVSYLTFITTVNPIEYKLPFERFLNPERPSAPDIDMDIADTKRDDMINYAKEKYGIDKVAQIGTFGTMAARGAVRDVTRALGFPYTLGDSIAKIIPMGAQGFPMTIDRAMKETPELKTMYKNDPDVKTVIDMAKKIEGCARHISVHAAGVVISPTTLTDFVPLQYDTKGENKVITQYDMHTVEDAGLLKFDFLGIRNLSILSDSVERVKKIENIDIDIENIPLDDKKTFEMLARGETVGLFQLNGSGMTKFLKDLKPSSIHDINAMVALYRPGPLEVIPEYIKRKHNTKLVSYPDPRMKKYLDQSYGLIIYQDDLLFSAIELAGYSWLEADKFRKAVGKKIPAEMAAQKEKLIEGIVKNGQTIEFADMLWKLFEPFQAYGFNKAHAACYGRVAYQTAYMKANFPEIYMSAVLTADSGDVEKIGEIITECKRMNIPVLPPSINESFSAFTVVKVDGDPYKIRFGLTTIKNFGQGISTAIIDERKRGGKFVSLADFLDRVRDKNLNKKSLEALIKAGALDDFGERGEMLANLEDLLIYNKESAKAPENQDSLFGLMENNTTIPKLTLKPAPPVDPKEKLIWEKELLGLFISGHPLDAFKEKLEKQKINIKNIIETGKSGEIVIIAGLIEELKDVVTKKNERMMFLRVLDFFEGIEVVVFPKIFTEFKEFLVADQCVAIKGKVSLRNGNKSIIAEKIKNL